MPDLAVNAQRKSQVLKAVVVRCGCGQPASHAGSVCPRPKKSEDLGVIAFWHRNLLLRLAYKFGLWKPVIKE